MSKNDCQNGVMISGHTKGTADDNAGAKTDDSLQPNSKKTKAHRNVNQLRIGAVSAQQQSVACNQQMPQQQQQQQQQPQTSMTALAPPPPPPLTSSALKQSISITQEKIIERIRNASTNLEFPERRWQSISEPAKQLLRGLLNVDPKKRMKLKDLSRHEWIRSGGLCASQTSTVATNSSGCNSRQNKKCGPGAGHEIVIDLCEPSPLLHNANSSNGIFIYSHFYLSSFIQKNLAEIFLVTNLHFYNLFGTC